MTPDWIAVDWGTTRLRVWAMQGAQAVQIARQHLAQAHEQRPVAAGEAHIRGLQRQYGALHVAGQL